MAEVNCQCPNCKAGREHDKRAHNVFGDFLSEIGVETEIGARDEDHVDEDGNQFGIPTTDTDVITNGIAIPLPFGIALPNMRQIVETMFEEWLSNEENFQEDSHQQIDDDGEDANADEEER